ncbi:fibrinogen-like protein 1 [Clytia hemisphaerica]|uniref:fibrinogen-like protein 1 n=1 Tax=Clytia hemisphaerica TaxID=252671 RepID=UPI0034D5159B
MVNIKIIIYIILKFQTFVSGQRVFELVSTGKTINATPYNTIQETPYPRCISICSLTPECRSFDYTLSLQRSGIYGECHFYDIDFEFYQDQQVRELKASSTTKYYSILMLKDCAAWFNYGAREDGIYDVFLLGKYRRRVFCLMQHAGGGWMAFQRRFDGSVRFMNRNWREFKEGFGNEEGEYYLGNELLNLLTTDEGHDWLVRGTNWDGITQMKMIHNVIVESETDWYRLNYDASDIDSTFSTVWYGEVMRGMKFSTFDEDHDIASTKNCAAKHGGWWHKECHGVAMNGPYWANEHYRPSNDANGIIWWKFDNNGNKEYANLQSSLIMIRPSSF